MGWIRLAGGIPVLVDFLEDDATTSLEKEGAALALAVVARERKYGSAIVNAGCIEVGAKVLRDEETTVSTKCFVAEILKGLAQCRNHA